ncbi:hypothetical protein [Hymenobacter guriensis]|uniref:Uncharacterized protein n=1 Tax=Hymenobacter guriensis TaxID=2793065 RepID=A0ABS0L968_9BACT|nr:hypothetical protein [Hymenobacter guriensis]MBG8556168.1 hypothetical protein [Hymenobacter guriensis]
MTNKVTLQASDTKKSHQFDPKHAATLLSYPGSVWKKVEADGGTTPTAKTPAVAEAPAEAPVAEAPAKSNKNKPA